MDYNNIEISYITSIYIENKKCNAVDDLVKTYESYSEEIRKKVYFIFIDDHSPVKINIKSTKLNYILLRVKDNINWNIGGARNLGVSLSKSSKMILTDLDHQFSEKLFQFLIKKKTPSNSIYYFRIKRDGKRTIASPNIFFCTKSIYYKVLGVDEEFCGYYGYEDIYFRALQKALGTKFRKIRRLSVDKIEHKDDAAISHHFLDRNSERNYSLLEKKLRFIKTKNPLEGHSRKSLLFDWEVIEEKINVE